MMAYLISKGDPFWTYSGGLAGIIVASAGNDLYSPLQALLIAAAGVSIVYKLHFWVEKRFQIDDAVGAVAVHGYAGVLGLVACGFMLWGYPASAYYDSTINPLGMIFGAFIMFGLLGFLPGWSVAKILQSFDCLRIPENVEALGLDYSHEGHRLSQNEDSETG